MYTISTTPGGRVDSAATIPDALAALASQLVDQLPHGLVAWRITDPAGTEHRGNGTLNGRLNLLATSIQELVDELYPQLHRSLDGGPRQAHDIAARATVLSSGQAVRVPWKDHAANHESTARSGVGRTKQGAKSMWGVTRRAPMTRAVNIPEYDRPLVTALVMAKSPRLALGRAAVHPHHGLGAVTKVIIGNSNDDLEWLEAATTTLGAQVFYLPIRRSDNRTAEHDRRLAISDVAYADEQAKAADAILARESQHATDRELRRIVGEGQTLRRRCLDRDLELTDQYVTHRSVDQAAVSERAADCRRYEELRDEYLLMNGGEPTTWPL